MTSSSSSSSPLICACFAANYIIGTGFLALPWDFYQAGWLFSLVCLAAVCWAENLASDYVLTALARAEWFLSSQEEEERIQSNGIITIPANGKQGYGSIKEIIHNPQETSLLLLAIGNTNNRHLDLPEVCQLFLNPAGYAGYMVSVHLYLYGSLWMFTSVFGNAVATYWQIDYVIATVVLGVVVLPLSCLQLTEQKLLQVLLTISRLLVMVLMVLTPIVAASSSSSRQSSHYDFFGAVSQDSEENSDEAPWLDLSGAHRMLPIVVCAGIFHFSIPALAADLGGTNKEQLGKVFAWTFVLVFVVYASIGAMDAWYFGGAIQQSCNVNWSYYHGGTGQPVLLEDSKTTVWKGVAWWAQAISFFVTMFPAINVISVFPLHALVLGNSLMAIWHQDKLQEVEHNRGIISAFRMMAAIPPLVGGLFVRDLGTIIDYNGIFGLAIAFIFPSWLYLASVERCPNTRTHYERLGSSYVAAMSLLVFGVVAQVTVLSLLVWWG